MFPPRLIQFPTVELCRLLTLSVNGLKLYIFGMLSLSTFWVVSMTVVSRNLNDHIIVIILYTLIAC